MIDFTDINYLKTGNARQRQAYQTLHEQAILEKLTGFDPILTGTIPIHIDIPTSDLDIVCYWTDKREFKETLEQGFAKERDFTLRETIINAQETLIANFKAGDFEIEIFGQNVPSQQQNAFKHLIIEHQLLLEKGEDFRKQIVALKLQGHKTEPAFAQLLQLKGDPYAALLNLAL